MAEIDLDAFIFEDYQSTDGFPVINGFIEIHCDEYATYEEWHDAVSDYIQAHHAAFLTEAICYPSTEIKMGCMPVFTPTQQNQVISECLNMKQPTETEVELVRQYGTIQQYAKIKLKL